MDTVTCPLFWAPRDIGISCEYFPLLTAANIVDTAPTRAIFSGRSGTPILLEYPQYDDLWTIWDSDDGTMSEDSSHMPNRTLTPEPQTTSEDVQSDNDTEFDGSQIYPSPPST